MFYRLHEKRKDSSNCKNGNHVVYKECVIKTPELCFCESSEGKFIYSCPICRSLDTGFTDESVPKDIF